MADFIEQQQLRHVNLGDKYAKLGDLYNRKLWHQLTVALQEFVSDPANSRGDNFIQLYNGFISKFETKINQLRFAQILCAIRSQCQDVAQAAALFEQALEKQARLGKEATLLLESELWLLRLGEGQLDDVKEFLARGKATLEDLQGADTAVHSAYYRLASDYYKVAGPPEAFYKAALMHLAYTPLESMPLEAQRQLATDISLAAVTGDGVFNFGEVLTTPALKVLEGTENVWLGQMLRFFNRGDIDGFAKLAAEHQAAMAAQPALVSRAEFVKEKIALLALMNMVFERPSTMRTIPFKDVAERTRLPVEQVEWLVMRAMSLSLVRGMIDEVDQELHVSWVQPRVLDAEQLGHLVERLDLWKGNVGTALTHVEEQTPELFG